MIAKGRSREEMIKQINSRSWSFIENMEIRICEKKKGLQEQNDIQRNNIRNKIGIRTKDIQDSLSEIEEIKKSCKKEELNGIIQDTKRNKKRTSMEMI